jgi:hypothetical protein
MVSCSWYRHKERSRGCGMRLVLPSEWDSGLVGRRGDPCVVESVPFWCGVKLLWMARFESRGQELLNLLCDLIFSQSIRLSYTCLGRSALVGPGRRIATSRLIRMSVCCWRINKVWTRSLSSETSWKTVGWALKRGRYGGGSGLWLGDLEMYLGGLRWLRDCQFKAGIGCTEVAAAVLSSHTVWECASALLQLVVVLLLLEVSFSQLS